jgi:hypothetical protein
MGRVSGRRFETTMSRVFILSAHDWMPPMAAMEKCGASDNTLAKLWA